MVCSQGLVGSSAASKLMNAVAAGEGSLPVI